MGLGVPLRSQAYILGSCRKWMAEDEYKSKRPKFNNWINELINKSQWFLYRLCTLWSSEILGLELGLIIYVEGVGVALGIMPLLTTPTLPFTVSGDLNIEVWVAFFSKLSHSFCLILWFYS